VFRFAQDGLDEYEIAYGVKNCVHSIMTYNNWRDKCLREPAYDATIHGVRNPLFSLPFFLLLLFLSSKLFSV
jgi:hypothetical protein